MFKKPMNQANKSKRSNKSGKNLWVCCFLRVPPLLGDFNGTPRENHNFWGVSQKRDTPICGPKFRAIKSGCPIADAIHILGSPSSTAGRTGRLPMSSGLKQLG